MSISFGVPRRRRRRPPPQSRPLPPRPRRRPPQPRPLLPQMHRLLPHRPRRLPHLHRLPLQVHRFQRRVATRGALPLQSRQRTVARRGRIAVPGLVAAHPSKTIARASKTIARALSRTLYQKGSAAIPAWQGRVSVASAVALGAVVNTDQMRVSLMSMPASWRPAAMAGRLVAPPACSALTVGPVCRPDAGALAVEPPADGVNQASPIRRRWSFAESRAVAGAG